MDSLLLAGRLEWPIWNFILGTSVLLIPVLATAQQKPQHRTQADVDYLSRSRLERAVTHATLSNGMTVLVRENHAAPVATVRCYVRNTGSAFEGRYLGSGISHMLEHLLAGGSTKNRSEEEIQKLLDSMGGRTNAFTSTDRTAFYIDCPSEQIKLAIELIADAMQHAIIPEKEFLREMGVVQRELEMGLADRSRRRYQALKSLIFTRHPARHPIIGYLPVVQSVERNDIIAFYQDRYVPQNMILVVAGDVNTGDILEHVRDQFAQFRRTTERTVVLPIEPEQASPRSTRFEMDGETTLFSVGWPTVPLQHPDLYPLDLISNLLTAGNSSRLVKLLTIDQPLAVGVTSASYTPGYVKGWFEVTLQCRPENLGPCRDIIEQQIERLKTELVVEEELAKAKRQMAAAHVFGLQTVQSQADSLASGFLAAGDPLFDDQYVESIQQVTADQIRDAARRYFLPYRTNTVTIDPPGTARRQADEQQAATESEVIRRELDNGLVVLLKRHAVNPVVSIQAFVLAGMLSDEDETSGRAALASSLMVRGTKKYSGDQIAAYFDSIGGALSTRSQRNSSYLQCSVLKNDFATSLDYVAQVLFQPTFPEDEFKKFQQQQLAQIAARKADARSEILDFWAQQLPKESPYHRTVLGSPETVSQLTVDECRRFHRQFIVPNNMVLSIFGDIDIEQTWELVKKQFGGQPRADSVPLPQLPKAHSQTSGRTVQLTHHRENTALVLISYATVPIHDAKTRSALDVLNSVLTGGGGAGGRLFQELRGERLVYYVFGHEITGPAPGYFLFLAQTLPQTRDEVIRRIQANLDRIRREGIPADEFELAKQKLIAAHAMSNTTPSAQAFEASIYELYGLGYDHDRHYGERIRAVTVQDVQGLLETFFHDPLIVLSIPEAPDMPQ